MLNFYRILLTFFNIVFFFFGISYILTSSDMKDSQELKERPCPHDGPESYMWMGVSVVVVTLIGIFISCLNSRIMELFYKWLLTAIAAGFISFVVFIAIIMPKKTAFRIFADGINNNIMKEFNPIVPLVLANDRAWHAIRECYIRSTLCEIVREKTLEEKDWMVDAGCCMPPTRCNMTQITRTLWAPGPGSHPPLDDRDCQAWRVKGTSHCYDCELCKATYLSSYEFYLEENRGTQMTRLFTVILMAALSWVAFYDASDKDGDGQNHVRLAKSYMNP